MESYYNAPNVYIGARVLLQVAAFEVLLNLPEKQPRKVFKDEIERLTNNSNERRFRYKFEIGQGRKAEVRSLKGIWADRFYTLRNHIVHGQPISRADYAFRGQQHHLVVAPLMFTLVVKRLIDAVREEQGLEGVAAERMDWVVIRKADQYESEKVGFRLNRDFGVLWEQAGARKVRMSRPKRIKAVTEK